MLTISELSERVVAYRDDRLSFSDFENWFEDNSAGAYDVPDVREACIATDAALSQYHFDHIDEIALKAELEKAMRPFASLRADAQESIAAYFDYRVESGNNSHQSYEPTPQTVGSNSSFGFTHA